MEVIVVAVSKKFRKKNLNIFLLMYLMYAVKILDLGFQYFIE